MSTEDEDTNWIAHSALVKFYDVFNKFRNISLAALAASALIILSFFMIMTGGPFEEGNAITKIGITLMSGAGLWVTISLVWIVRWMFINRKLRGRLLQIRSSFAHRSYVTTFELVRPVGKTKIDRICNHLSLVFPEVQQLKKRLEEPPWYKFWLKKHQKFSDIKKDSTNLADYDLVLKTSTGIILLKIFEKTVTHDDIDQLVHRVGTSDKLRKFFTDDHMSRVICLADKYEPWFETEDFIKYMDDSTHGLKELKIDLILEDSKGYSTIWIDR
jgi:hypothetical protein